ncbi:MAG: hypothetical protein NTY86_10415 [Deltaproteobacteria bacterium]|nr:hypothetical protein [Deltaproteobacteria bacterium]
MRVRLISIRRAKLFDKMYGKRRPIRNMQTMETSAEKWLRELREREAIKAKKEIKPNGIEIPDGNDRLSDEIKHSPYKGREDIYMKTWQGPVIKILIGLCVGLFILVFILDIMNTPPSKTEMSNLLPKKETVDPYRDQLIESIVLKANQYGSFKYSLYCGKATLCEKEIKFYSEIDPNGEMHFFMNETEYRVNLKKISEVVIRSDKYYRVLTFACLNNSCIYRDRNGIRFNAIPWSQLVDIPIGHTISFFEIEQLRNNYMKLIEYYKQKI